MTEEQQKQSQDQNQNNESSTEYSSSSSSSFEEVQQMKDVDLGKQITIQQLCTQCGKNGIAKMQFINIPKFGDLIVSSFKCKNCGFRGRDVQQMADIQNQGIKYTLTVKDTSDLQRSVIKSSNATLQIPEIGLTNEPRSFSGEYTTVEGIIQNIIQNLSALQPERRIQQPQYAQKIDEVIQKLIDLKQLKQQWQLIIDDPSGNSYIQQQDNQNLKIEHYNRNVEQAKQIGLSEDQEKLIQHEQKTTVVDLERVQPESLMPENQIYANPEDVTTLKARCPACGKDVYQKSLIITIPYFKQVLIMSCRCDECGYKTIELQPAGEISKFGRRITFKITDKDDLNREILKSTTCAVEIPELGVQMMPGTLGSMFTTIEGLLVELRNELQKNAMFYIGDSIPQSAEDQSEKKRWEQLFTDINNMIMDDLLDNSFIKDIYLPDSHDPNMKIETYERTEEQNANLGLDICDKGQ